MDGTESDMGVMDLMNIDEVYERRLMSCKPRLP